MKVVQLEEPGCCCGCREMEKHKAGCFYKMYRLPMLVSKVSLEMEIDEETLEKLDKKTRMECKNENS